MANDLGAPDGKFGRLKNELANLYQLLVRNSRMKAPLVVRASHERE
jgi:hypothetical protein